jgi:hypothetical protein
MDQTSEIIINVSRNLTSEVNEILPPRQVLQECHVLSEMHDDLAEVQIGHTEAGNSINAYEFGNGPKHILLYGFPDPGESVGGTTIVSLLKGLVNDNAYLLSLDATWHCIPCLNLDDQPDGGKRLVTVFREPDIGEVDWCLSNPRSETRALLDYAERISPAFTFPLHDEYHSGESIPLYIIVSEVLDSILCERVRMCMQSYGMALDENQSHETMGPAFGLLTEMTGDEYANSTFSIMSTYGLVAGCEISQQETLSPSTLVAAQITFGLIMIDAILKK